MKFKIISLNKIQNHIINEAVLHLATRIGNSTILKLLLKKKEVDINIKDSQGKKPIDYSENTEIKQLLSKDFRMLNDLT